jgi:hypothetical protein
MILTAVDCAKRTVRSWPLGDGPFTTAGSTDRPLLAVAIHASILLKAYIGKYP